MSFDGTCSWLQAQKIALKRFRMVIMPKVGIAYVFLNNLLPHCGEIWFDSDGQKGIAEMSFAQTQWSAYTSSHMALSLV